MDEADSGTEMPSMNGALVESDDDGSGDSDEGGMFDGEASSTDADSASGLSDEDIDHDSVDTGSSEGDTSPHPKRQADSSRRVNGTAAKKR